MQNLEYLQLNINYYPSVDDITHLSNNEDSAVWKSLQNYLDSLNIQGWIMINETISDKGQSRTYHLKRPIG
jgi:hypothetical protein